MQTTSYVRVYTRNLIFSLSITVFFVIHSEPGRFLEPWQIFSALVSGIFIGLLTFFLQWYSPDQIFTIIELDEAVAHTHRMPQRRPFISIRRSKGPRGTYILSVLFYGLAFIGAGVLFGHDLSAGALTGDISDLISPQMLFTLVLGMLFSLVQRGSNEPVVRRQVLCLDKSNGKALPSSD